MILKVDSKGGTEGPDMTVTAGVNEAIYISLSYYYFYGSYNRFLG